MKKDYMIYMGKIEKGPDGFWAKFQGVLAGKKVSKIHFLPHDELRAGTALIALKAQKEAGETITAKIKKIRFID